MPAIEQAIDEGINVNVTLLFSVEAYARVAEAFIRGLERREEAGESVDVHSVASFFVSRVDTEVDKRLEAAGRSELQGHAAIANARAAYQRSSEIFQGERFAELREAGAPVQRPLWASTGVKNPHVLGDEVRRRRSSARTPSTRCRCRRCWRRPSSPRSAARPADEDPTDDLEALAEAGIDLDRRHRPAAARRRSTSSSSRSTKLLEGVESTREAVVTGRPPTIEASIPEELEAPMPARVKEAVEEGVAQRIWRKDESLWGGPGVPEIGNRLGWLTISEHDARAGRRAERASPSRSAPTASPTPFCSGWAARASAPR